ncbi:hypothetical protein P3T36_004856 [Kitasatospora sp. MAP12-15]|uniref:hypothetical protein n=1 Tax=unclassified Kitasatospora TaxID=2633591 RepID=UPI00247572CC|nr:hypothetical protein [Kitasatospora sp. MAP12-44]MDH6110212.1 hypothetical protein [Kitasatospora sp. MAP12-44]
MHENASPTVDQIRARASALYAEQRADRMASGNIYAAAAADQQAEADAWFDRTRVIQSAGPEAFGRRSLPGRHLEPGTTAGPTVADARNEVSRWRAEVQRRNVVAEQPQHNVPADGGFWGQLLATPPPAVRNRLLGGDVVD